MIKTILTMYITMMPVILAGISNMVVVKRNWFKKRAKPMDGGKELKDGKRIFGNNKTWLGFFTMIGCSIVTHTVWGLICRLFTDMQNMNQLYLCYENTLLYNIIVGAIMGAAYMIFELPNSFIKRRLDIPDGKTERGLKGKLFFVIDQLDSMFGVILVLAVASKISLLQYINYVLLGGLTHICVNLVLYKLKIRRNL